MGWESDEKGPPEDPPQRERSFSLRPVFLTFDELDALRLVDLEGLFQDEAARVLGISRKTLGLDLREARRKVAFALVNGLPIRLMGGSQVIHDDRFDDSEENSEDRDEEKEEREDSER